MKTMITSLLAASQLLIGVAVHAQEAPAKPAQCPTEKVTYEGISKEGATVRLVVADVGVDTFKRTDAQRPSAVAGPSWSARIGTGMQLVR
ncbi:MAG TPA: hypothetical protein VGO53_14720 [Steroidobacteraceae bacterium]|nr:hypothetical protein [Steroidobacteraceae bacterium]